jgi:LDH2 family malate/lactate/ureidoglycolate dehydrogenase
MAANEGLIGLALANDTPGVTAPGARGRVLGSNPLAYAVPNGTPRPILFDAASSTVAAGKVLAAHALGKKIPADWIVDADGSPTTDPGALLRGGALTPMAGHKGYGLALLIETLAGIVPGAAIAGQVLSWTMSDPSLATGHGAAFIAIDAARMLPAGEFEMRVNRYMDEGRSAPRAPGCDRIYLPGEMEWERREKALNEGVLLPADVMDSVRNLSEEIGIQLKQAGREIA